MARPRQVRDDLAAARASGIDTVISLLEADEAARVGLGREAAACADAGLRFVNHPIRDMQLPDPARFASFVAEVAARLRDGSRIAVHCHASIGRSGMLTCCVLGQFGFDAETALRHVSARRGVSVPDTAAQADFIRRTIATSA